MASDLGAWVIVFDLDDTLYREVEYCESGIAAVGDLVKRLYAEDVTDLLLARWRSDPGGDTWAYACDLLRVPHSVKESLLWCYRLHAPQIALSTSTAHCVRHLTDRCAAIALLTEGRAITQRLKLHALGLGTVPVFISEELGVSKLQGGGFRQVETRWPGNRYAYVGDNPAKDFLAPNALGWLTIGLRDGGSNVHPQALQTADRDSYPKTWVNSLSEVVDILCCT